MKITHLDMLPDEAVSHNAEIRKKVLVRQGEVPGLTQFSQACFAPGQRAAAHVHLDMYEVFWVESGEGEMWINGERYELTARTCITVAPGDRHEVVNTGTDNLVLTYFGIAEVLK